MKRHTEFGSFGQSVLFNKRSLVEGARPYMRQGNNIFVYEGNKSGDQNELVVGVNLAKGKVETSHIEATDDSTNSATEIRFVFRNSSLANEVEEKLQAAGFKPNTSF